MSTEHIILNQDARDLMDVPSKSIDLIVTSPPYPMIEMWDEMFFSQNSDIKGSFKKGDFELCFELMHKELDKVWLECSRVLKEGGFACINIGDATRTLSNNFRLFSNHSRIISGCLHIGFQNLPNIIWRKQTNAPNKFMGSGMLPAGAYVTLEHEFILIFRKGCKREFNNKNDKEKRHNSAYFWEERNSWFSDLWDLKGTNQLIRNDASRKRSAAFPYAIPHRLINMYSVEGDTVLDPFTGTGTTSMAAIGSKRNSIGVEIDTSLINVITTTLLNSETYVNNFNQRRIENHLEFVKRRIELKGEEGLKYTNEHYQFPVMTKQEKRLSIPFVREITSIDNKILVRYKENVDILNFERGSLFD
jgi:DNA modification methylase